MENFALSNGGISHVSFSPTHKQFGNSGPETSGGNMIPLGDARDQKYVHNNIQMISVYYHYLISAQRSFPGIHGKGQSTRLNAKVNMKSNLFNKARYQRDLQKYKTILFFFPINVCLFWKI